MTKQEPEYVFSKLFHSETIAMTDTLKVAEVFGKRHDNIIQTVKNLDCSDEFRLLNFQASYYLNEQNKRQPKFNMTQDGFTFLVMGFRGKKAAEFKEAYIKQFNEMREWISKREHLSTNQHILNDAIQMRFDGEHFAYTRKKWLADNLYPNDVEIRECLNAKQLQLVELLTIENAVFIKLGMNYTDRKTRLLETALHFERKGN